jgi:hypothetical protein
MKLILQPVSGRYRWNITEQEMSEAELTSCMEDDDDRFMTGPCPAAKPHWHQFTFQSPSRNVSKLTVRHEGYFSCADQATIVIGIFKWPIGQFAFTNFSNQWPGPPDIVRDLGTGVPRDYISEDGLIVFYVRVEHQDEVTSLYTDRAEVEIDFRRISESHNLFGQHFRAFDDGAAGDISFERRDVPAGDWSTPTQPFAGGGNSSPAIECLPDGRLRAAYIDADGNLVKAQSRDDGETWEVV